MSEQTKIQWCDSTHNFWRGCSPVSAGCANCYAKKQVERFGGDFKLRVRSKDFDAPLRWNKKPYYCPECERFFITNDGAPHGCVTVPHRRRVFSLSLGDWLDPDVPVEWLADMLDVVRRCENLDWILCTKRPDNFGPQFDTLRRMNTKFVTSETRLWIDRWYNGDAPKNITILASVENQKAAEERIPHLLRIPAARRGLSVEPLLGPVDLSKWSGVHRGNVWVPDLNWVIVGGESGPKARPCNVEWIRRIVSQCKAASVPCFVKQFGREPIGLNSLDLSMIQHPKGGDPEEWPKDLRVREWLKGVRL